MEVFISICFQILLILDLLANCISACKIHSPLLFCKNANHVKRRTEQTGAELVHELRSCLFWRYSSEAVKDIQRPEFSSSIYRLTQMKKSVKVRDAYMGKTI